MIKIWRLGGPACHGAYDWRTTSSPRDPKGLFQGHTRSRSKPADGCMHNLGSFSPKWMFLTTALFSVFKNVTTLIRETFRYAYRKTKNHCWYHVTQGSQWNIRLRSPEYSPLWPCDPTQQWPFEVREAGPWPGQDHHLWRQLDLVPNLSFPPTSCVNLSQVQNFSLPQFPSLWNGDDVACWLMTLVWRIKENYLKSKGLSNPQFVEIHAMCNVSHLAGCGNCGKK